jgi:acetoin utilization protein AcuB
MQSVRVRDIMSSPAIVIDSQSSLPAAHLLMKEHGLRRLPVVDDGQLVGIITLGDVRGASPSEATTLNLFELSYLIDQLKVERVMTREVITVTPETSLAATARLMLENKISGLPVVAAEGRVVGVVTESDIFRVLVERLGRDE